MATRRGELRWYEGTQILPFVAANVPDDMTNPQPLLLLSGCDVLPREGPRPFALLPAALLAQGGDDDGHVPRVLAVPHLHLRAGDRAAPGHQEAQALLPQR